MINAKKHGRERIRRRIGRDCNSKPGGTTGKTSRNRVAENASSFVIPRSALKGNGINVSANRKEAGAT
jgi:hypothetical protein